MIIEEKRRVCFGNRPLEIPRLRSIKCISLQVKENLTMVVDKLLSSIMRSPEEASPQLALSDVPGTQACSVFLLIHPELVGFLQNGSCPSWPHPCILAKTRRKEGRAKPAVLSPLSRKQKCLPWISLARPGSCDCFGCYRKPGKSGNRIVLDQSWLIAWGLIHWQPK